MTTPRLTRGAKGAEVRRLQDQLNKTGALLELDGDFGRGTLRALHRCQALASRPQSDATDADIWRWLESQPPPSAELSCEAVTFVAREEVGSREYYDSHVHRPHFPGEKSGVTIGVGYDLKFRDAAAFTADWGGELDQQVLQQLSPHLRLPGSAAAVAGLAAISIPFESAWRVFLARTLPEFIAKTRGVFTTYGNLPDLCRGVLVSLVYNRGESLSGDSRKELRNIRNHLAAGDLDKVAGELRAMKRLWGADSGLTGRREREARLWERAALSGGA